MGIEARDLRDAMGCFATGIAVVTTLDEHSEPVGMTINSFNSVSLDPPLVLFSVAKTASRVADFLAGDNFAINILRADQEDHSNAFAKTGVNGFESHAALPGNGPAPLLAGTLASFEGRRHAVHDGGDHHLFIIEIEHLSHTADGEPLLYYRGRYCTVD